MERGVTMFDFTPVSQQRKKMSKLAAPLPIEDLRSYTNEMIDTMLSLIADSVDADVVFEPIDPQADDTYAETEAELHLAWTLGHIIVHVTASAEESAFLAAELARGVKFHGRSRYEVPWQTVISIAQCRDRLEESRKMRLALLDVWPAPPHLDNTYEVPGWPVGPINCVTRYMLGLSHDNTHLDQIKDVVQQSRAARK
jgi:hypothetical protein